MKRTALLAPRLTVPMALFAFTFAIALVVRASPRAILLALHAVALTLLAVTFALLLQRVEWIAHVAGSRSRSEAASSGAIRPSASSRRISLRRSVSRSGSACEGKPSARITASRRDRTVG